jgi:hypothetical protein
MCVAHDSVYCSTAIGHESSKFLNAQRVKETEAHTHPPYSLEFQITGNVKNFRGTDEAGTLRTKVKVVKAVRVGTVLNPVSLK